MRLSPLKAVFVKTRILKQLWAAAAGAALLSTAACSTPAATNETNSAPSAETGAYPLTMKHIMGSTTIEERPERVVALDPSYIDGALLLGADLVGYVQYRQDPDDPFAPYGSVSLTVFSAVFI